MNQEIKDWVDVLAKIFGIGGGLLAAFKGIDEFRQNRILRERDLRWKQANAAKSLMDELFDDPKAKQATVMLDYEEREYEFNDKKQKIVRKDVIRALTGIDEGNLTAKDIFIRDCFDNLLYYTDLFEQSIKNTLFEQKDIEYPMHYFADIVNKVDFKSTFRSYIDGNGSENSIQFFDRFIK
jgi:hypothetical protein